MGGDVREPARQGSRSSDVGKTPSGDEALSNRNPKS